MQLKALLKNDSKVTARPSHAGLAFWYFIGDRFFAIQENSQLRPNCSVASSHLDSVGSFGCTWRPAEEIDMLLAVYVTAVIWCVMQQPRGRTWLTLTLLIHGIHVGILSLSSHIVHAFSMGTLTDVSALQTAPKTSSTPGVFRCMPVRR